MTFSVSFLDHVAREPDTDPKVSGVMVGRVINILDPLMLGRVQVQIPSVDALDLSPWARVAMPAASLAAGMYWIPNIGDEVLVAFENGALDAPYVIGCLWSAVAPPPLPTPVLQIRGLRTPLGNQILMMEEPTGIIINTADGLNAIVMLPTGMQLISGTNIISLTPDGISMVGATIKLVAQGEVTITAPSVTVAGAGSTSVTSGGTVSIKSPLVTIN
ncbi:MAG TPA: phage baseplate assembly protein V [Chloroflexota bacterium]